jgi:hypothetical protein
MKERVFYSFSTACESSRLDDFLPWKGSAEFRVNFSFLMLLRVKSGSFVSSQLLRGNMRQEGGNNPIQEGPTPPGP